LPRERTTADPQVSTQPIAHFSNDVGYPSQKAYPKVKYLLSATV
jgi:hypothetical protein